MQNISFPILIFTPATNIDASGNLKIEIQKQMADIPKRQLKSYLLQTGASPKIDTQIQSLIEEIGTKEDKNNTQMS